MKTLLALACKYDHIYITLK